MSFSFERKNILDEVQHDGHLVDKPRFFIYLSVEINTFSNHRKYQMQQLIFSVSSFDPFYI